MKSVYHYICYKNKGLKNAWSLSNMTRFTMRFMQVIFFGLCVAVIFVSLTKKAEAIQEEADNRVAAKIANQQGEISELRKHLATCLGDKEGAIWIGNELHLCRAVPTGVKK